MVMAFKEDPPPRLLHGEMLRELEREHRDLTLSLKALAALLRREGKDGAEEHVLGRILEAEVNQLSVLVGEITAALHSEEGSVNLRSVDLSRALAQAASRTGVRAGIEVHDQVTVLADPAIVLQIVESALSLAVRVAEGLVVAHVEGGDTGGEIVIRVPVWARPTLMSRRDGRLALLRKMTALQGGRLGLTHQERMIEMRIWFPHAQPERHRKTG